MPLSEYLAAVTAGLAVGTVARAALLRSDYRQYPAYPHGYVNHLTMGLIAAALGAVSVPALLEKQYTAVTFLALAAQSFRQVRKEERDSLVDLDTEELVPRGGTYIDGISKVFEARNYLAMLTALVCSATVTVLGRRLDLALAVPMGVLAGIGAAVLLSRAMVGRKVGDVCRVRPAEFHFLGPSLYVEGAYMMNVGLPASRDLILKQGLAAALEPNDPAARATLANVGQRQALVHDAAAILGIYMDIGEMEFTPLARLDHATGAVMLFILPQERDMDALLQALRNTPLLESAWREPRATRAGRMAYRRPERPEKGAPKP